MMRIYYLLKTVSAICQDQFTLVLRVVRHSSHFFKDDLWRRAIRIVKRMGLLREVDKDLFGIRGAYIEERNWWQLLKIDVHVTVLL